jgi:pimeloyl-ACP methyl ester carboxylesterase
MAEDVLAAHNGPLAVAGHSMGARVALEMVRLAPERIVKLALLDTGVHPRKAGEEARRKEVIDLAFDEGMEALAEQWLPPMVHPDRHEDRALMETLTAMVMRMTPELHERQITALLNRPEAAAVLEKVTCPTLFLVGRQDAWSPVSQHEDMLRILPHAHLVVIEDAGHFAPVERPEDVTEALVQWLEG